MRIAFISSTLFAFFLLSVAAAPAGSGTSSPPRSPSPPPAHPHSPPPGGSPSPPPGGSPPHSGPHSTGESSHSGSHQAPEAHSYRNQGPISDPNMVANYLTYHATKSEDHRAAARSLLMNRLPLRMEGSRDEAASQRSILSPVDAHNKQSQFHYNQAKRAHEWLTKGDHKDKVPDHPITHILAADRTAHGVVPDKPFIPTSAAGPSAGGFCRPVVVPPLPHGLFDC